MKKYFLIGLLSICLMQMSYAILPAPGLVFPQNAGTGLEPNVVLDWSAVAGATGYEYRIAANPGMNGSQLFAVSGISQGNTSNLRFGTTFYWQVRALKTSVPADSSEWSAVWNFSTLDRLFLLTPQNGETGFNPTVLLDWSGISGITAYDYQWDTSASFNSGLLVSGSVSNSSQVNTPSLRFGTKYFWRVRARHASDTSQWSAVWNFSTIDQLFMISPQNGGTGNEPTVVLDWSGITGITAYDYEWDTSAAFNSALMVAGSISNSSQVNTPSLRFGTKYFWRVRARNESDTSQWSAVWNFSTLDQLFLVSPQSNETGFNPTVLLDWSGISGVTAYDYQWDTSAAFTSGLKVEGSVSNSSQVNTPNLRFGTRYFWRVRARNAADTSQWSAVWNFTTLDQLFLVSPQNNDTGFDPTILLDWSGITGITAYDYQWDTSAAFNSGLLFAGSISNSSQVNSPSLLFGTKYFWRVRARHASDTSKWSAVWNFSTLNQLLLVSPQSNETGFNPTVLLDWSGISGITAYDYQWDTSAAFNSGLLVAGSISNSSQLNAGNLRFGTTYFWRVRARHNTDTSLWSEVRNFSILEYPLLILPQNGETNVSLNPLIDWAGISGITAFQYRFSANSDFANASLVTGTASQANLINLLYGTTYYWQVRACHIADTSDWSPARTFTTLYQISAAPLLLSPANATAQVPFAGTTLSWSSVATATFYEFLLDEEQSFNSPLSGSETTTSASTGDLMPSTTYFWKVRAGNGSGFSAWSEVRSFTTETATELQSAIRESALQIFPNPSCGLIKLLAGGKPVQENSVGSVYSTEGIRVHTFRISAANSQLDLQNLPKGMYLIRIQTEKEVHCGRISLR
jgi:arginine exporter protein ArgO